MSAHLGSYSLACAQGSSHCVTLSLPSVPPHPPVTRQPVQVRAGVGEYGWEAGRVIPNPAPGLGRSEASTLLCVVALEVCPAPQGEHAVPNWTQVSPSVECRHGQATGQPCCPTPMAFADAPTPGLPPAGSIALALPGAETDAAPGLCFSQGTSTKYSPQRVGLTHTMEHEDVIQIVKK